MSSKVNAACKTVATRNNKNTLEKYNQPPSVSGAASEGVALLDNCSTVIEVTVKTKGRKRTSTMVSSSPNSQKAVDEKRRPTSSGESHQSWGRILREQNRPTVKQSLQQLTLRTQSSKSTKHANESKDIKKHKDAIGHHKSDITHKHLDEMPVKQNVSHIKGTPCIGNPSCASIGSSMDSILVLDRAVQCGGIFDCPNDKFGVFNPVRTLGFLMKELEHLVKDGKAAKILTDMEQVLFRIPTESGKPSSRDLEAIALRAKLEASTVQLEETSKKMNAMCETMREERDSLQRQVHKQAVLLSETRERELHLESTIKTLRRELEEAIKTTQTKEKIMNTLKEEIKGYEFSQKIIADLRTNLTEQTELARQRHLEMQYLTLEKDKLSVLSSYKDSLLVELRNAVKELQNHIAEQLAGLKNAYIHEENSNPQISLVHRGAACSSPTSTSSHESNVPTSWHEISDVSLSVVEHNPLEDRDNDKLFIKSNDAGSFIENTHDNSEMKREKNTKQSTNKDSAQLEFISLPAGEFSQTILPTSYKDFGCTDSSQLATKEKSDIPMLDDKKNDHARKSKDVDDMETMSELLSKTPGKVNVKDISAKSSSRVRRTSDSNRKEGLGKKYAVSANISKTLEKDFCSNPIGSHITEQFQNMFEDFRLRTRMPVSVPSPPRNYPHPDWSDSTLPSISATSDLNVLQSNDT